MKALTIQEPWAGLIVGSFVKSHGLIRSAEIRKWNTKYRGPLLIHAGSKINKMAAEHFKIDVQKEDTGAILGFVMLKDVIRIENEKEWHAHRQKHLEWGKRCYGNDTYMWSFENPVLFEKPIFCDGKLGLWSPTADILKNLDKQKIPGIAYKVLGENLSSLGLMGAREITYMPNEWNIPREPVSRGPCEGGLWVTPTRSAARAQQRYAMRKHRKKTRMFRCVIGKILRRTSCRIKTDKLFFDLNDEIC
ncbi:MAG: hypothetical protein HYT93_03210 [Parcubacteria group bacterium]|nr:hypothetical protein [Parcubacteria group bacterium]